MGVLWHLCKNVVAVTAEWVRAAHLVQPYIFATARRPSDLKKTKQKIWFTFVLFKKAKLFISFLNYLLF